MFRLFLCIVILLHSYSQVEIDNLELTKLWKTALIKSIINQEKNVEKNSRGFFVLEYVKNQINESDVENNFINFWFDEQFKKNKNSDIKVYILETSSEGESVNHYFYVEVEYSNYSSYFIFMGTNWFTQKKVDKAKKGYIKNIYDQGINNKSSKSFEWINQQGDKDKIAILDSEIFYLSFFRKNDVLSKIFVFNTKSQVENIKKIGEKIYSIVK